MKIEIVEFYKETHPKSKLIGTLHIYVIDLGLDIRGICVYQIDEKKINFRLPFRKAKEDGKWVFYPVINFTDHKKNQELMKAIRKEGKAYIKEQKKKKEK